MKIYNKEKPVKQKSRTVKSMLIDLENLLDITIEGFNLNKKENLLILVEAIEERFNK